jgi:Protein of unknown function (DUF1566)
MRHRMIVGNSVRLIFLFFIAAASLPVSAQNQTPANVAPPAWLTSVWRDPNTGLMWTRKDNGFDIKQTEALNYCGSLSLGDLRDWRLPEIDELAQIYDASVVSGGFAFHDGVSHDLHVKGGIQMTGCCGWSGSVNRSRPGELFWALDFMAGVRAFGPVGNSYANRALCVRRAAE